MSGGKTIDRPNLRRVAEEICAGPQPERVAEALLTLLEAQPGVGFPDLPPEGGTNNRRFNRMLNESQYPQEIFAALAAWAQTKGGKA